MKITINGQDKEFPNSQNLHQIISQFCSESQRVIAEVNGEIIKTPQWEATPVKDGDTMNS